MSPSGKSMKREATLSVFGSIVDLCLCPNGTTPFENKDLIDEGKTFPADFIQKRSGSNPRLVYTSACHSHYDSILWRLKMCFNGLVLDKEVEDVKR